jgi:hypothetical protein
MNILLWLLLCAAKVFDAEFQKTLIEPRFNCASRCGVSMLGSFRLVWQVLQVNQLKKRKFVLVLSSKGFDPWCLAPLLWSCGKAERHGREWLLGHSPYLSARSKNRRRKWSGSSYSLPGLAPGTSRPPWGQLLKAPPSPDRACHLRAFWDMNPNHNAMKLILNQALDPALPKGSSTAFLANEFPCVGGASSTCTVCHLHQHMPCPCIPVTGPKWLTGFFLDSFHVESI